MVVRDAGTTVIGFRPDAVVAADGAEAFEVLQQLKGWWAGYLAYDLGRAVERVPTLASADPSLPDLLLGRFDARLVLEPGRPARVDGDGPTRNDLTRLLDSDAAALDPPRLLPWRTSLDLQAWTRGVETILDHLRAGDCYQVNLTRRLQADTEADPVALFRVLNAGNPAPHAALIRLEGVCVVSASPERFLRRDGTTIETRPIKGTSADAQTLERSAKDRAENVMIVDLARNDIGRICEYGSVHVPALFELEAHPGIYHLVSTVRGTLRDDVGVADIIRATFPPASITGAPKPSVLKIIEELEPVRRGVYCGAIGFIDTQTDRMDLNVAIRTFTITQGRTFFGVGAGIVADSDPQSEWEETELKARRLLSLAGGP